MGTTRFKINYSESLKLLPGLHLDYCDTYERDGQPLGGRWVKQNRRPYQEDYLTLSCIKCFQELTAGQKSEVLKNTFDIMSAVYGNHESCGSTACAAVVSRGSGNDFDIIWGNLGDSSAYLVDLEKNNRAHCSI